MFVVDLCNELRERRKKSRVQKFYDYQQYLEEKVKEDQEILDGQHNTAQINAAERKAKVKIQTIDNLKITAFWML